MANYVYIFAMLSSTEHEISTANKIERLQNDELYSDVVFIRLLNLTFVSMLNSMLS